MVSYNEEMYHVDGYDKEYKGNDDYENVLIVEELFDTLEEYLKEGSVYYVLYKQ